MGIPSTARKAAAKGKGKENRQIKKLSQQTTGNRTWESGINRPRRPSSHSTEGTDEM